MHDVQSPRTDDSYIEQEIRQKGLTAPRVTPADIEANIAAENGFTVAAACAALGHSVHDAHQLLTLYVLVLKNGFTVVGKSACASPENFDAALGMKIARADAVNQIWPLMGYALKDHLASVPADHRDRVRLEKEQLDEKRMGLAAFFGTSTFAGLPAAEQQRMRDQLDAMRDYSTLLGERIEAFAA